MKMHSMAAALGLVLAPSLASAADGAAAPTDPAAPAADPAEPAPAATPADTGAAAAPAPASKAAPSTVINLDVETTSAYVWRGMNLYGDNQNTQTLAVFPSLTAAFGSFSVGYFSAYQLTGDNKSDNVDAGAGAQQTLILKYGGPIMDKLSYSAGLVYWIYPFATKEAANTDTPMTIEPGVSATYSTAVDLSLYVGYYRPLQDVNKAGTNVYISPSVAKSVPLTPDISLALGLSAGYKAYTNLPSGQDPDKALDLTLNAGSTIPFSDMYITPQVHAAFVTRADAVNADFGDEFIAWASVHVGYNLGI
jgi:hypothetical protein